MCFECYDYGQGHAEEKFGFCIGERVWWVGIAGFGHNQRQADADRELCQEIVRRWNEAAEHRLAVEIRERCDVQTRLSKALKAEDCQRQRGNLAEAKLAVAVEALMKLKYNSAARDALARIAAMKEGK